MPSVTAIAGNLTYRDDSAPFYSTVDSPEDLEAFPIVVRYTEISENLSEKHFQRCSLHFRPEI